MRAKQKIVHDRGPSYINLEIFGPVHTNPFSNEHGAVLLRFQNDLRPHLSFSYRFRRPHYNAVSALKTLLHPALSAHTQMISTHAHLNISVREIGAKLKPHGSICPPFWISTHAGVVWHLVVSIFMTSPFSDSIVFSVHTRKQRFQKASFSNRSTLESVFEWLRFR